MVDAHAVAAGRTEWRPIYGPETEATATALALAERDYDIIAKRLAAKPL